MICRGTYSVLPRPSQRPFFFSFPSDSLQVQLARLPERLQVQLAELLALDRTVSRIDQASGYTNSEPDCQSCIIQT